MKRNCNRVLMGNSGGEGSRRRYEDYFEKKLCLINRAEGCGPDSVREQTSVGLFWKG